ncbi:MAG: hypothetical protein IPK76_24480 [Lewinellaceae bacterium]|jgi:hypothetical protein|nr:hypothetical protein [Lewinellaceae bacterium]
MAMLLGLVALFALLRWWLRIIIALLKLLSRSIALFLIVILALILYYQPDLLAGFLRGMLFALLGFLRALAG